MAEGYGKRILVVDDNADVRFILSTVLEAAGFNVYGAGDGLEAVECLKRRRYDVLLTDYRMPKMDGLELLDMVRAMWPDLPVIMVTGDRASFKHDRLGAEAFAVVDKPFDRAHLLSLVAIAAAKGAGPGVIQQGRRRPEAAPIASAWMG
ncbi:Putative Response regulator, CheY-like (modular protein) [Nitrospira japonica]|uniref:Putative Response regulator, CheY-like (Modular protein) n=1 Tax=Nitrospira japonica TaxID=1325564 RepID=A0A1W1I2W8_9BACT|nr:response regulator [Nitrospira japonica]SLM47315.1 Putative Response regulator, CheY-like (modular protein) [Nitrospira japonica]